MIPLLWVVSNLRTKLREEGSLFVYHGQSWRSWPVKKTGLEKRTTIFRCHRHGRVYRGCFICGRGRRAASVGQVFIHGILAWSLGQFVIGCCCSVFTCQAFWHLDLFVSNYNSRRLPLCTNVIDVYYLTRLRGVACPKPSHSTLSRVPGIYFLVLLLMTLQMPTHNLRSAKIHSLSLLVRRWGCADQQATTGNRPHLHQPEQAIDIIFLRTWVA